MEKLNKEMTEGMEETQPWDPIEGKLVKYSVISGVISLVVLGILINTFLLK
ncbi:hypothetical protein DBT_2207 [Dissulfuribacter thermophilus]|uniref:Uncharacterized protein n=1 Tax=Dissulfuribacter thermophilus TaxID=1156395 RepID=A0A1B9F3C6_9BACT|nr:hypothetical protein [Dissulfuribacter thermophilus]OCC14334.1 hypothetical protein DBT_2207 [Dissulfuribacter thermophilus]